MTRGTIRAVRKPLIFREGPTSVPIIRGEMSRNGPYSGAIQRRRRFKKPSPSVKKFTIAQVLSSRILTVCGEVAEWLKAMVC